MNLSNYLTILKVGVGIETTLLILSLFVGLILFCLVKSVDEYFNK